MGKSTSKKFNNSLAVTSTDIKSHPLQHTSPVPQQMHFANMAAHSKQMVNGSEVAHQIHQQQIQFKSVNHSIDQTMKELS